MLPKILKVCMDVKLPPERRKEAHRKAVAENPANASKAALLLQKKWLPGRTLRVNFLDGDPQIQARVVEMAQTWSQFASIRFDFGSDPNAEIHISFAEQGTSWSYMGTDALSIDPGRPTMNFGWLERDTPAEEYSRVVKHEFGHALGLIHEHQHPDANIPWNKPAVYAYYWRTQRWPPEEVDAQIFAHYSRNQTQYSAYDPKSIMHYSVPKELTTNGYEVGWNTDYSPTDKQFITAAYPGAVPTTELAVNGAEASAAIGKHGEVDRFVFTVEEHGAYVIETKGKTDVLMALFGEDDQLIGQDDDSGQGRNARILATLEPGAYTTQVRHYSPTGTGSYKISVKRAD